MALRDHELEVIAHYVPEGAAEDVLYFMHSYHIHLKIKKERKAILGDYRPAFNGKPHTISVNGNLNPFHFLITFIHELAHLINYLNHQNRVAPHGKEWKSVFKTLLKRFIDHRIFPNDLEMAIYASLENMGASTCSNPDLYKVLHAYNEGPLQLLVDHLTVGDYFFTDKQQQFQILEKRRTRYLCVEVKSGKKYLFPGICEVYRDNPTVI